MTRIGSSENASSAVVLIPSGVPALEPPPTILLVTTGVSKLKLSVAAEEGPSIPEGWGGPHAVYRN